MLWSFQDSAFKMVLVGVRCKSQSAGAGQKISKIKSLNRIELLYPAKQGRFLLA